MKLPKRISIQDLASLDASLAEQVQAVLMREKTKHIVAIGSEELEPARKYILGESGDRGSRDYNAAQKSFRKIADKYFQENKLARSAVLTYITRLQGGVSQPSENPEDKPLTVVEVDGQGPFPCEFCDRTFVSKQALGHHGSNQHSGQYVSVREQQKRLREDNGENVCDFKDCGREFDTYQALSVHRSRKHGLYSEKRRHRRAS